jgi:hypothetical protein
MTWSIQSLVENRHLDLGWKITAVVSAAVIFGRPVYGKLRSRVARDRRTATATAPEVEHAVPVPVALAPAPIYGGYDIWAALHREAADAAERWLAAILGERPVLAMASGPMADVGMAARHNAENRAVDKLRVAAVRALHAPVPGPRRPGPIPAASPPRSPAGRNAEARALDELRAAAVRELGGRRGAPLEPLPVRNKSLPVRRRSEPATSGDMNAVMVTIARPDEPYRRQISEAPDSHTRAHTTSGARTHE